MGGWAWSNHLASYQVLAIACFIIFQMHASLGRSEIKLSSSSAHIPGFLSSCQSACLNVVCVCAPCGRDCLDGRKRLRLSQTCLSPGTTSNQRWHLDARLNIVLPLQSSSMLPRVYYNINRQPVLYSVHRSLRGLNRGRLSLTRHACMPSHLSIVHFINLIFALMHAVP